MIIYWRIGNDCNLGCKYCGIVGVHKFQGQKVHKPSDKYIDDIAKFIRNMIMNNGASPPALVLYGGEPLLYQESIIQFLNKTRDLQIKCILHTNGTLLSELDVEFLKNINTILVSVDGNKTITDKYRGDGTYHKIREGVKKVRKIYDGEIIARVTLTLDASIKECVMDLIGWLDGVVWQIENSSSYDGIAIDKFLARYKGDLKYLTEFWMNSLRQGHVLNILPFQAVASTLLLERREDALRCGCGSRLVVIDGEECFACDELEGKSKDVYLGTIYENINPKSEAIISEVNRVCKDCPILYVCGGRCFNSLSFFPPEKFQFYCKAVSLLVEQITLEVPELKSLIKEKINIGRIKHPILDAVDQIP